MHLAITLKTIVNNKNRKKNKMNSNTINVFNNGRPCRTCFRRVPDMAKDENWVNANDLCNCQSTVDMLNRRLEERKAELFALLGNMKGEIDQRAQEMQERLVRLEEMNEMPVSFGFRRLNDRKVETNEYLDAFYEVASKVIKNVLAILIGKNRN
ncbi:MAG: hypothetical protein C5B43_04580 [Verrucomicrobia bacterium]|nr:MAG: hypothetical protein C5B43_04580 [Verrucomicrobiota bacterium]